MAGRGAKGQAAAGTLPCSAGGFAPTRPREQRPIPGGGARRVGWRRRAPVRQRGAPGGQRAGGGAGEDGARQADHNGRGRDPRGRPAAGPRRSRQTASATRVGSGWRPPGAYGGSGEPLRAPPPWAPLCRHRAAVAVAGSRGAPAPPPRGCVRRRSYPQARWRNDVTQGATARRASLCRGVGSLGRAAGGRRRPPAAPAGVRVCVPPPLGAVRPPRNVVRGRRDGRTAGRNPGARAQFNVWGGRSGWATPTPPGGCRPGNGGHATPDRIPDGWFAAARWGPTGRQWAMGSGSARRGRTGMRTVEGRRRASSPRLKPRASAPDCR